MHTGSVIGGDDLPVARDGNDACFLGEQVALPFPLAREHICRRLAAALLAPKDDLEAQPVAAGAIWRCAALRERLEGP